MMKLTQIVFGVLMYVLLVAFALIVRICLAGGVHAIALSIITRHAGRAAEGTPDITLPDRPTRDPAFMPMYEFTTGSSPLSTPLCSSREPRPHAGIVQLGKPIISGNVSLEALRKTMSEALLPRLECCYDLGLDGNSRLGGPIAGRFVIGRDGAVAAYDRIEPSIGDEEVLSCVETVFHSSTFPMPSTGIATVVYSIRLIPR